METIINISATNTNATISINVSNDIKFVSRIGDTNADIATSGINKEPWCAGVFGTTNLVGSGSNNSLQLVVAASK